MQLGTFFIIATPIGNLADISLRALESLKFVDVILAEDTRVTQKLLQHYQIKNTLESCNAHQERKKVAKVLAWLGEGKNIAFVLMQVLH